MRRRLNGKAGKNYGERNREYREGTRVSMEMNPARGGGRRRKKTMTDNLTNIN